MNWEFWIEGIFGIGKELGYRYVERGWAGCRTAAPDTPAVASLPRPAVGHLGFATGTVLSEPRITRIAQADCADGMGWVS